MQNRLRLISYNGVFIALVLAMGYALAYIPNFELVTMLIFLSGYYLGIKNGLLIGFLGEFLFSALNPMGSGLIFPPMLIAQVLAMGIVGLTGGIIGKTMSKKEFKKGYIAVFGGAGLILTLIYDMFVSLAYPLSAGFDIHQTIAMLLSGVLFSALHLVTNFIVFTTILPLICIRLNRSGIFNEIKQ
jgi:hypothetical protein